MKIFNSQTVTTASVVTSSVSGGVSDVTTAGGYASAASIVVDTNAAGTWAGASLSANHVTITGHGWKSGLKGQVTTVGVLPTGLSTSTDYFIIVVDANTVKFATSYANAIAGTAISLSGGSGNSTFTPTALAGATVQAQWSNDGTVWVGISVATTITVSTVFGVTVDRPDYRYLQFIYTVTAGSLSISTNTVINKDSN